MLIVLVTSRFGFPDSVMKPLSWYCFKTLNDWVGSGRITGQKSWPGAISGSWYEFEWMAWPESGWEGSSLLRLTRPLIMPVFSYNLQVIILVVDDRGHRRYLIPTDTLKPNSHHGLRWTRRWKLCKCRCRVCEQFAGVHQLTKAGW